MMMMVMVKKKKEGQWGAKGKGGKEKKGKTGTEVGGVFCFSELQKKGGLKGWIAK